MKVMKVMKVTSRRPFGKQSAYSLYTQSNVFIRQTCVTQNEPVS